MKFNSQILLNLLSNSQHRFIQRTRLISIVTIFLSLCWFLTLTQPALAGPSPQSCKVGVYLLSLRDFLPSNKSFGGDFWIWSNCPSKDLTPLESMEVVHGKNVQTAHEDVEEKVKAENKKSSSATDKPQKPQEKIKKKSSSATDKPQKPQEKIVWAQRKISATFQHDWMVANFPFDRHQLEIPLEETKLTAQYFVYTPDGENSSYKQDMNLDGWKIKKFEIRERREQYRSTFGDPNLKNGDSSEYSRLSVLINIERDSTLGFFKLIAGVYAAFTTIILAFFLDSGAEFGNRTSLLVGSLFTVLVSMQSIDSVLGQSAALTMVGTIHVTTLAYIFVAVLTAIYSKRLYEQGYEKEALKFDRKICSSLFGISFTIFNIVMITHAMLKG